MPKKVSLIIPAYNAESSIEDAIESALEQDYPNLDITVVDDGSSDMTSQKAKKYSSIDSRVVKYIRQDNMGASAARNTGIAQTDADYITFLDSDDTLPKDSISKRVDFLENNPEKNAVCGTTHYMNKEGRVFHTRKPRIHRIRPDKLAINFLSQGTAPFTPMSVLYKREVFEKLGSFDTDFERCEDADFMYRLLSSCDVGSVDDHVYNYVVSSHKPLERLKLNYQGAKDKLRIICKHSSGAEKYWLISTNVMKEPIKYLHQTLTFRD